MILPTGFALGNCSRLAVRLTLSTLIPFNFRRSARNEVKVSAGSLTVMSVSAGSLIFPEMVKSLVLSLRSSQSEFLLASDDLSRVFARLCMEIWPVISGSTA